MLRGVVLGVGEHRGKLGALGTWEGHWEPQGELGGGGTGSSWGALGTAGVTGHWEGYWKLGW